MSRATNGESVVYIVEIGKHIKIGFSTNLEGRLKAFQTSSADVELLLAIPGGRDLERTLHEQLEEVRVAREMFQRDRRIIEFIYHYNYGGLDRAMQYLKVTTPAARAQQKTDDRRKREAIVRQNKAEKDAYFASLVADRKSRIGW